MHTPRLRSTPLPPTRATRHRGALVEATTAPTGCATAYSAIPRHPEYSEHEPTTARGGGAPQQLPRAAHSHGRHGAVQICALPVRTAPATHALKRNPSAHAADPRARRYLPPMLPYHRSLSSSDTSQHGGGDNGSDGLLHRLLSHSTAFRVLRARAYHSPRRWNAPTTTYPPAVQP